MNAIIIEDEQLAAERMALLLRQYDPGIRVLATLGTVRESVFLLTQREQEADFLLMDVQLADGPAFDIFRQVQPSIPVIFTTAYDTYALEAFQVLSIDYLLKPVSLGDLARAIGKIKLLRRPTDPADYRQLAQALTPPPGISPSARFKSRFLGRTGQRLQVVSASDVACFTAEGHVVRMVAKDNTRYLVDYTLEELETLLDPAHFFRINRSTILHDAAIGQVRPVVNSRLNVSLKSGGLIDDLIVSRERVADFKKWIDS